MMTKNSQKPIDRRWLMALHFSGALELVFPMGAGCLAVWLFWRSQENKDPVLDRHGRNALRFHLSFLIYKALIALGMIGIASLAFVSLGDQPFVLSLPQQHQLMEHANWEQPTVLLAIAGFALLGCLGLFCWIYEGLISLLNGFRSFTEDDTIYPLSLPIIKDKGRLSTPLP